MLGKIKMAKGETTRLNDDVLTEDWVVEEFTSNNEDIISVNSDDDFMTENDSEEIMVVDEPEMSEILKSPGKLKRLRDGESVKINKYSKKKKWQLSQPVDTMTLDEQIDLFMQSFDFAKKSTKVQLQPLGRPDNEDFVKLEKFGKHSDASLTRFIRFLVPDWKKSFKMTKKQKAQCDTPSPKVVIVCISAKRCVELLKHLVEFKSSVGKLFSKHMNVKEQHDVLSRECPPIAVGTPNRLRKMLSLGYLELDRTTHIIIDMKVDSKDYHILNLKDTQVDFMDMFTTFCQPLVSEKRLRIALY